MVWKWPNYNLHCIVLTLPTFLRDILAHNACCFSTESCRVHRKPRWSPTPPSNRHLPCWSIIFRKSKVIRNIKCCQRAHSCFWNRTSLKVKHSLEKSHLDKALTLSPEARVEPMAKVVSLCCGHAYSCHVTSSLYKLQCKPSLWSVHSLFVSWCAFLSVTPRLFSLLATNFTYEEKTFLSLCSIVLNYLVLLHSYIYLTLDKRSCYILQTSLPSVPPWPCQTFIKLALIIVLNT